MKNLTKIISTLFVFLMMVGIATASVGTIVDINLEGNSIRATAQDNETGEIVRFEDVDPALGLSVGCVVDYTAPTEQELRNNPELGATINSVLSCPGGE